MYARKEQGTVYFKVTEKQKGVKIDLDTGIIYSQTTGLPYKEQRANPMIRLFEHRNDIPTSFRYRGESILRVDEPTAIISLFWQLGDERYTFVDTTPILQMFHTRRYAVTYDDVIRINIALQRNQNIKKADLVNFIIDNEIVNIDAHDVVTDYAMSQYGILRKDLTEEQMRIIRNLQQHQYGKEHIEYILRKCKAEHIEYVVSSDQIIRYFRSCREMETDYNRKNFLNAYATMRYTEDMEKEAKMAIKVKKYQKDAFKLDDEKHYCVMPTTPKEFTEMGRRMANCIAGYYDSVANGNTVIVFVYSRETNAPIINIDLNVNRYGHYTINSFLGRQNDRTMVEQEKEYYLKYKQHIEKIIKE
jgi:hypothetical protein